MKKMGIAEHATVFVSPRGFHDTHTVSTLVAHGGSSSSSAPSQVTTIVEHARLDDSDKHIGSKKLKLSEPGSLLSGARMSADANLSSGDMRVNFAGAM